MHDIYGKIQQSFKTVTSALHAVSDWVGDDLTYVEHYPPRRASTFSNVHGAQVCRIGDNGEDFTLKTDWGAMVVFGFAGFTAGLSKRMTGEKLGVSPLWFPVKARVSREGWQLPRLKEVIYI